MPSLELVVRLAAHRKVTEGVILDLARDPTSAGAPIALLTLGFWDEPGIVDLLIGVAHDPARSQDHRERAVRALCRLEAVETLDTPCAALEDESTDFGIGQPPEDAHRHRKPRGSSQG
jgi:hypothetical protein